MILRWDPLSALGASLSNANRTATLNNNGNGVDARHPGGGQGGVRGNIGYATGQHYLEFVVNSWDPTGADSPAIGITDQPGDGFPGFPFGQGIGFSNNDYYWNGTEGGNWAAHGTVIVWARAAVVMSAGPRYGVKVDCDNGWADLISLLAPEGTHQRIADGGHDAYAPFTPGTIFYPTAGMPFANGVDHSYTVTIYGQDSEFLLPHDPAFKAWGPADGSLLALL